MSRHLTLLTALGIAFGVTAAAGQDHRAGAIPQNPNASAGSGFTLPVAVVDPASGLPTAALTDAMAAWLGAAFDLPDMQARPRFALVPPKRLVSLRLRGVASDRWAVSNAELAPSQVVAIYADDDRTIYLPEGWTGGTPAELSVVVHELVHHLQNEAGLKFACPEVREDVAFAAQARWLGLFGTDLHSEFGIDAFTLLVRTNCPL